MGNEQKAAKTLATTFPCLFCTGQKSVMATLDKKAGVAHLSCNVCDQHFQTRINCECHTYFPVIPSPGDAKMPLKLTRIVSVYRSFGRRGCICGLGRCL